MHGEEFVRVQHVQVPYWKNNCLSFQLFSKVILTVSKLYFSLLSCAIQTLPTFHCKVKELLVLCEGLGGKGHSGAALWVVKLTGSEQDPFTELYIAYTLETIFKWFINLLTVTRWDSTASAINYQMTDFSQTRGCHCFTWYKFAKKRKNSQQKRNIVVFCANIPLNHRVIIIFSFRHYFLAFCQTCTHRAKILFTIQQKVWIHEEKV